VTASVIDDKKINMTTHHNKGPALSHHEHMGGDARVLKITSWLTGIYFGIELAIGIYTGSVAVLSDSLHTFSAVGGILLALVASRIAARPATKISSFGMKRAEIIGALINGFFLFGMAILVIVMGAMRLQDPIELPVGPMFGAAIGGLIIEIYSLRLLYKSQKDNLNMKGAYWHVMQTFIGSLIIIVSATVIHFTGFLAIDPLLGMGFGFVLIYASWTIIKGSLGFLLETVPEGVDLETITHGLTEIDGVEDIHHIHSWALTSGTNIFSTHVKISEGVDQQRVLADAHSYLEQTEDFYFSTVQVEAECLDTPGAAAIDIMKGSPKSESQAPEQPTEHHGHHMH
jgi:cobalt-zinc-cadmium efflux system protein